MRKGRRKKLSPDYAPWGVQCENRKNTSATQKHIHDITTGEVNPAQQAAIWSRSHWSGAGQTRLTRPADRSEQRRMVGGGGGMSVGWGRNQVGTKKWKRHSTRSFKVAVLRRTRSTRYLTCGPYDFRNAGTKFKNGIYILTRNVMKFVTVWMNYHLDELSKVDHYT